MPGVFVLLQTTIMAASFPGGVVLGADTRTSTGSYVANRVTNKLTQLADKVFALPADAFLFNVGRGATLCACHPMAPNKPCHGIMRNPADWFGLVLPQVFVCRSGSAADTQAISAYVEHYIEQHEMELGRGVAVKTAANLAMQLVYNNKVSQSNTGFCLAASFRSATCRCDVST
jgi:20S proteasome subunit beta 1